MLSKNFGFCPKLINLLSKRYSYGKSDQNPLPLIRLYSLKSICHNSHVCIFTKNFNDPCAFKIFQDINLRYSTNPLIIPPPVEETEVFGELGGLKYEKVDLDEEELKEEEKSKNFGQVPRKFKPSPGQYADMIKNYTNKGDLNSAEMVLEECKRNRDKPTDYMYTLLIRAFAMQGDIPKCYKYYTNMKSRGYKIKANTYTSLINACANSPNSEKALMYLERIKEQMNKQKFTLNHAHYNVLVKAYGRHQQLEEANNLLKVMIEKKLKIGISTLNSLMYAANSDIKSGLTTILKVWQLMRKLKVPPDVFSYHLLLRGIRDTHFGPDCTINNFLIESSEYPAIVTDNNRLDLLLYPPVLSSLPLNNIYRKNSVDSKKLLSPPKCESTNHTDLPTNSSSNVHSECFETDSTFLPASIVNLDLDSVLKQNKLILFGGLDGLIQKMKSDKIKPNAKTMTYLIDIVPGSIAAEEAVIKYAKSENIRLDIDFYNNLIKKRSFRGDIKAAKNVINDIHKADLKPNVMTYGVLALTCTTPLQSRNLLKTMQTTGHTVNKYIADSLLSNAFFRRDFPYILELMELLKYERVRLEEQTFVKFDEFQQKMTELVKKKDPRAKTDKFKVGFSKFNLRYKSWQEDMGRKIITEREEKLNKQTNQE